MEWRGIYTYIKVINIKRCRLVASSLRSFLYKKRCKNPEIRFSKVNKILLQIFSSKIIRLVRFVYLFCASFCEMRITRIEKIVLSAVVECITDANHSLVLLFPSCRVRNYKTRFWFIYSIYFNHYCCGDWRIVYLETIRSLGWICSR